jgi:pyruvate kinase
MQRTKIIATIGPSCEKTEQIRKLIESGVDVARLNLSHNTREYHAKVLKNIREAAKKEKAPIAVIFDLQGPKLRIGKISDKGIIVRKGEKIALAYEGLKVSLKDSFSFIPIQYKSLFKYVKKDQIIYIDDAQIELKTLKVENKIIYCRVENDGKIKSHKGINVPGAKVKQPSLTEKDLHDLDFAIKNKADFVAFSYVSNDKEVKELRERILKLEKKYKHKEYDFKKPAGKGKWSGVHTRIISKIENPEALRNFKKILEESDAVMIARGDLGIEVPLESLPVIQKEFIKECLNYAKPVIVATQMLNSMIKSPYPTRAEVSDVANAVFDGSDALMLSGETASGKYPNKSVKTMFKIIREAEPSEIKDSLNYKYEKKYLSLTATMAAMCKRLAIESKAKAVICSTTSGFTARALSRYKLEQPIVAFTPSEITLNQLNLSWGVVPVFLEKMKSYDSFLEEIKKYLIKNKLVKKGDAFVVVTGHPLGYLGEANSVKVEKI